MARIPFWPIVIGLVGPLGCGGGEVSTRVLCSGAAVAGGERVFVRWSRTQRAPAGLARFPDGGQPTVLEEHLDLVRAPAAGGSQVVATVRGTPREPLDVAVSRAGEQVIYRVHNARPSEDAANPAVLVRLDEGTERVVSVPGHRPRLSGDGTRVASIVDGGVHVGTLDGATGRTHAVPEGRRAVHAVWTSDGLLDVHVMGGEGSGVVRLDPGTGAVSPSQAAYATGFGLERVPEALCTAEPQRR